MNEIEKAIEELERQERNGEDCEVSYDSCELAIEVLKKQLNDGWIPVSERMPENQPSWISGTTYIITKKQYNSNIVTFAKYKEKKWIGNFGKIISDNDVLAWQCPEPYEEVEKN